MSNRQKIAKYFYQNSGLLLVFFGLNILLYTFLPFFLAGNSHIGYFNEKTGAIGDTIGGIAGPFVAIIASLLTFLAFIEQLNLNREQMEQFKEQKIQFNKQMSLQETQYANQLEEQKRQFDTQMEVQNNISKRERFESQFFELLKMRKEFVNQMKIYTNTIGMGHPQIIQGADCFKQFYKELLFIKEILGMEVEGQETSTAIYSIFFAGIDNADLTDLMKAHINKTIDSGKSYIGHTLLEVFPDARMPHIRRYFRSLYHIANFITKAELFNTKEKYEYFKTLKHQLSGEEQLLLLLNSLSKWGGDWITYGYITEWRFARDVSLEMVESVFVSKSELYKLINEHIQNDTDKINSTGKNSKNQTIFAFED